jgi:hypothetical protein
MPFQKKYENTTIKNVITMNNMLDGGVNYLLMCHILERRDFDPQ